MIFGRKDVRCSHQHINLRRRVNPRLTAAGAIQFANGGAVFVVHGDAVPQGVIFDRAAAQAGKVLAQCLQFTTPVNAPCPGLKILRQIHVADVALREQHGPHARQVADHIADGGKQHAIQHVEPVAESEFDGAARDVADVALEVGIAADDLQALACAHNADWQHPGGMDQLARNIDGHVSDGFAPRPGFLPGAHRR